MARYYISIWDLHKEIKNLTLNDSLRPLNHDKGPQWLSKRIKELPRPCDISTAAYKLRQLEYRALWRDMAKEHQQVVSTLMDASASTSTRAYNCLFNQALLQMVAFLEHFATRAAPFSADGNDQFKILMDNFSAVVETVCVFYDRFDCEGRSETLRIERDQGRDEKWVFCFVKNEWQPPGELSETLGGGCSPPVASPGLFDGMSFGDLLDDNMWELNQWPDDCWSQGSREMPIAFHY